MSVNLEEVACLVLAVALLAGNLAIIGLTGLVSVEEQGIPRGFLQIACSCVLSFLGLIAVYKIPNSWWFRIVYESANKDEFDDAEDAAEVGYLH